MVSCDVVQWRRVRRRGLVEGKPIELVATQESLTVEVGVTPPSPDARLLTTFSSRYR